MIYEEREVSPLEEKAKKTQGKTFLPKDIDTTILQTIPYKYPWRRIVVELSTSELSCLCPFSDLPDCAHLSIRYIPRKKVVELKSLKYYLFAFRNVSIYNEHIANKILEDLKKVLTPYELRVTAVFTHRGGIQNTVTASYKARR